jgi:hypothetical protein
MERRKVFETNSSSTHCVSIDSNNGLLDSIEPNKDGIIILNFQYIDDGYQYNIITKEYENHKTTPLDRLNYLMTYLMYSGRYEDCNLIISIIKETTGAKTVELIFPSYFDWDSENDTQVENIIKSIDNVKLFIHSKTTKR